MKKLLAIAVTAALTAPMAAMADTTVYGSARMLLGDQSTPNTSLFLKNNSSRIGLKGSNAIGGGLSMTHKFELGVDPTGSAGGVTNRSSYLGFKGGFGEVRIGNDWTVMDNVDDGAGVLTNGGGTVHGTDGNRKNTIKYLGKFGPVGVLASMTPKQNQAGTKSQLGLTYKAGPIYAGIATDNNSGASNPLEIVLAYNGANYRVGLVNSKNADGDKANSFRGKYSFGKAYVAAQFGKKKAGVTAEMKQTDFEVGYKLAKSTKVYFQSKKVTTGGVTSKKGSAIGVQHDF